MSDFGTITLQTACGNCSCGYSGTNELDTRGEKVRRLSDDLKKPQSTITISQLKIRLTDIGIRINIDGSTPCFIGDLYGFCQIAQRKALEIIESNKVDLIRIQSDELSECGC